MAGRTDYVIELKGKDIKDNSNAMHDRFRRSLIADGFDAKTELTRDNTIKVAVDAPRSVVEAKLVSARDSVVGTRGRWLTYKIKGGEEPQAATEEAEEPDRHEKELERMSSTFAYEFDRMQKENSDLRQAKNSLAEIKNNLLEREEEYRHKISKLEDDIKKRTNDYNDLTKKLEEIGSTRSAKELLIREVGEYASALDGADPDVSFEDAKKAVIIAKQDEREWMSRELGGREPPAEVLPPWEETEYHLGSIENYKRASEELDFLVSVEKGELHGVPPHIAEQMRQLIKSDADKVIMQAYEKEKEAHVTKYDDWKRADDFKKVYAKCADMRSALGELPSPVPVYVETDAGKIRVFAPVKGEGVVSKTVRSALPDSTMYTEENGVLTATFDSWDDAVDIRKKLKQDLGFLGLKAMIVVKYS